PYACAFPLRFRLSLGGRLGRRLLVVAFFGLPEPCQPSFASLSSKAFTASSLLPEQIVNEGLLRSSKAFRSTRNFSTSSLGFSSGMANAPFYAKLQKIREGRCLTAAHLPLFRLNRKWRKRSVKVTEKHYAPWVLARKEQLEADVRRTWGADSLVFAETKGTHKGHRKDGAVN
ncbi:MAG: hypothetical protein M3Y27_02520, partial [Acidobacteriota bacterium]|nr:hypothetical protein [Acidobacteriota bacterium]